MPDISLSYSSCNVDVNIKAKEACRYERSFYDYYLIILDDTYVTKYEPNYFIIGLYIIFIVLLLITFFIKNDSYSYSLSFIVGNTLFLFIIIFRMIVFNLKLRMRQKIFL